MVSVDPTLLGLPAGIDFYTAYLFAGVPPPGGVPTCNDHALFDDVHPMIPVMQILSDEWVQAVPEPVQRSIRAAALRCKLRLAPMEPAEEILRWQPSRNA